MEYFPPTVSDEDVKAFEEAQKQDFENQVHDYVIILISYMCTGMFPDPSHIIVMILLTPKSVALDMS